MLVFSKYYEQYVMTYSYKVKIRLFFHFIFETTVYISGEKTGDLIKEDWGYIPSNPH